MRNLAVILFGVTLFVAGFPWSVLGQTSSSASTAAQTPATPGFLTSYRYHLNASRLMSENESFGWDTDFGGDLDVFDLKYFRGNVLLNFESIVGEQIRAIDPNQGNYTADLSAWWRTGALESELGMAFHHVSRHLSDRDKEFAISWNMLGFQYVMPLHLKGWDLDIAYRMLKTVQRSFVDYTAEVGGGIQAYRPMHRRVSLLVGAELTLVSVDPDNRGRSDQMGSRLEIGARFPGGAGFGEVFLSREQRIDADPMDLKPTNFTMLGFRFLSN